MKHMSVAAARAASIALPQDVDKALAIKSQPDFLNGVFDSLIQRTEDQVHVLNAHGTVVWANASALKMNGILNLIPAGWQWEQAWPAEFQAKALAAVRCALQQGNARFSAHTLTQAGVKRHWDVGLTRTSSRGHATSLVVATAREVGPDFMDAEVLRRLENLDRLTGLPNRAWFQQELSRRTADQTGRGGPLALVMMDLDGFKQLNSSLGAQACDAMLVRFADLMVRAMGESCFLARSGGDEFALIVAGEAGAGELTARIGGLIRGCSEQISTSGQLDAFSVSAGISLFSGDVATDQELMRNAQTALRAAKAEGRGRCVAFDGSMRQQLQKQASMLDVARAAIAGDWIRPYYQPKVDLSSGRVVGLEALLRWSSEDGVIHPPASIAAAFDEPELASRIGAIMLKRVIADVAAWARTRSALPVAINASGADFRNEAFAETFLQQIAEAGLPTSLFELEVTEGVFLGAGAEGVSAALRTLNAAGVRIALDDFGTGYASLSHLKQHPVDIIKIDRSFIKNLADSPDDRAIVGAMIGLSKNLAMEVVAEGIETFGQIALLRDLGCHTGQGFLFDRAVPGAAVPGICRHHRVGAPTAPLSLSICK